MLVDARPRMTAPLWLKAIVKTFLLPPVGLILLAFGGLIAARRGRGHGWTVALASLVALFALSLPVVAVWLVAAAGVPAPFAPEAARDARAIVILGGGLRHNAADYGGIDTLAPLTLERVRYGAYIARRTGLPVLVSGGAPEGSTPEADVMRDVLEQEYGVPVRWAENASFNTHDNAVLSARILRREGIDTVVLVTHGFDTRRAAAEFRQAGIRVVPAATGLRPVRDIEWIDLVPSIGAWQTSYYALYEIVGMAAFTLGRLGPASR